MLAESPWFKTDIAEYNLGVLSLSQSLASEQRVLELRELADGAAEAAESLISDGLSAAEAVIALLSQNSEPAPTDGDIHKDNLAAVSLYVTALSSSDRVVFASLLVNSLRKRGFLLTESDFLSGGRGDEVVVYVKNKLADEAFDVFSEELDDPRVLYAKDFREAAHAVSGGKAEFCLLPLEERGGVRISSVSALLYSEDLKINSVTPVFGPDGGADMKYALISRHFSVPDILSDSDRYFEFRLSGADSMALSEIFLAASYFGASVYRINSAPHASDGRGEDGLTVVLEGTGLDFTAMIVYLTVFLPSYIAVGIYDNIE